MPRQQVLYYAAAGTTAIAGIIHLILALDEPKFGLNSDTLFLVGGAAQIFWIVPMIKKWGTPWYIIGISGTAAFVAIWTITRMQDNPITGRAGSVNQNGIIVEAMQLAFIGLVISILAYEKRRITNVK
ncbi:MAG TPA: hypothetical protein VGA92_06775 [Candidatus Nitrosotenuis sp.]|jgi:hypothetical protein